MLVLSILVLEPVLGLQPLVWSVMQMELLARRVGIEEEKSEAIHFFFSTLLALIDFVLSSFLGEKISCFFLFSEVR